MKSKEATRLVNLCFPPNEEQQQRGAIHENDIQITNLCRLWGGKGNIYKVNFSSESGPGVRNRTSFVVKRVDPPSNPNRLSFGDRRKANSYIVEANFFKNHAKRLHEEYDIKLPTPLYVEVDPNNGQITICMSLLEEWSNTSSTNCYTNSQDEFETLTVKWLAQFHAATWFSSNDEECDNDVYKDLQPVGSYWHLDTRPEEHRSMSGRGWEGRLKRAARAIDSRLKRDMMQCIIHGDAKDANVLVYTQHSTTKKTENGTTGNDRPKQVAFCDFQYCGKGCPTQDLAYFLCSSASPENERVLIQAYYDELSEKLAARTETASDSIVIPTIEELKESLEIAYCDFCRFMCGWGMWGFDLKERVVRLLNRLDQGKILKSEEDYEEAMRREFG